MRQPLQWAYGVTTVPQRGKDLLPRTLASLAKAGFPQPRLFVDGDSDPLGWERRFPGLEITCRWPALRAYGNWILGLAELFIRNPNADRYAMFQDDLVTYTNLRQYLERCPYPAKGYLNLYTVQQNQELCPVVNGRPQVGWYLSNQRGRGAVALVFDRLSVTTLLGQQSIVQRPLNAHRGFKVIDGGVIDALTPQGWKEYVHNPSLVQHVGEVTTIEGGGVPRYRHSPSFREETLDALTFLGAPAPSLRESKPAEPNPIGATSTCAERCNCVEGDPPIASLGYFARRRHDNAGDLEAVARVLGWLREGKYVCHLRFGDGEFNGILGREERYGNHPRVPALGTETRGTLLNIAERAGQINAGSTGRVLIGGEWEYDRARVWPLIRSLRVEDTVPWCPSQIFVQGIYNGATLEILKLLRAGKGNRYLVGNRLVCEAICGPLRAEPIHVRYDGSYFDMPQVLSALDGKLSKGDTVLWCAGVGGKPALWQTYLRHHETNQLDFGHFFDGAVGDSSRTWLTVNNPRRQLYFDTVVPWLRSL